MFDLGQELCLNIREREVEEDMSKGAENKWEMFWFQTNKRHRSRTAATATTQWAFSPSLFLSLSFLFGGPFKNIQIRVRVVLAVLKYERVFISD